MPHSTLYTCAGCGRAMSGDEQVTEFIERRWENDGLDVARETPIPHYSHRDPKHEFADEALGHVRSGRTGVLDQLRDTWPGP